MDAINWERISRGALEKIALNVVAGVANRDGEPDVKFFDHATAEQRAAILTALQGVLPEPVDSDLTRIKQIVAKSDADITAAEVKEAILKYLRKHT